MLSTPQQLSIPSTPHRPKANPELSRILGRLRDLGLANGDFGVPSSPSSRGSGIPAKIKSHVQRLFYSDLDLLRDHVTALESSCGAGRPNDLSWYKFEMDLSESLKLSRPRCKPLTAPSRPTPSTAVKTGKQTQVQSYYGVTKSTPVSGSTKRPSPDSTADSHAKARRYNHAECQTSPSSSRTTSAATSFSSNFSSTSRPVDTAATSFNTSIESLNDAPGTQYDGLCTQDEPDMLALDAPDLSLVDKRLKRHSVQQSDQHKSRGTLGEGALPCSPDQQLQDEMRSSSTCTSIVDAESTIGDTQSHRLKRLQEEPLCKFKLPRQVRNLDLATRWLIYTLSIEGKLDITQRLSTIPRSSIDKIEKVTHHAETWVEELLPGELARTRCTYLRALLNPRGGALEDGNGRYFEFAPREASNDALNRLERRFGPNRFLNVHFTMPDGPEDFQRLGLTASKGKTELRSALGKYLTKTENILGTHFKLFWIEEKKHKGPKYDKDHARGRQKRGGSTYTLIYFAVNGPGIDATTSSLLSLFDYIVPIDLHLDKPFFKMYARVDLYLSRTAPTISFSPDQVHLVRDTTADGTAEATLFDDPRLTSPISHDRSVVMDDGCSTMSPAAARRICQVLEIAGDRPTAFQGRINGAKGMWTIAGSYHDPCEDVWIKINDSQLKIIPRTRDCQLAHAEDGRWTFEVVTYSSMPQSSNLHVDFLPILADRGIPLPTLIDVTNVELDAQHAAFDEAIDDAVAMREWIADIFGGLEARNREHGIRHRGGWPRDDQEKAICMLEHGFKPTESHVLGEALASSLKTWSRDVVSKLQIRLPDSVMVFGIADPCNCLKPGEIHLGFSQSFGDLSVSDTKTCLEGEVLVARHPAMRNSDIQKVRAIYKQELSHLRDVVVFPTKGCIPLASKLQGGDYDGDTFWICFDQRLVSPFCNAPAPIEAPKPERYAIWKDIKTLGEVLSSQPGHFRHAVLRLVDFQLRENMLGTVTNNHKALAYERSSLSDLHVCMLADVHNLIIDAAKNGYYYERSTFETMMRTIRPGRSHLPDPAYKVACEQFAYDMDNKSLRPLPLAKQTSAVDKLVIEHVIPRIELQAEEPDTDLLRPYERLKSMADRSSFAARQLRHLEGVLTSMSDFWRFQFANMPDDVPDRTARVSAIVAKCEATIENLLPIPTVTPDSRATLFDPTATLNEPAPRWWEDDTSPEAELAREWLDRDSPHHPSRWEQMRASTLYRVRLGDRRYLTYGAKAVQTKMAFTLAGRTLCLIKAYSSPGTRAMVEPMHRLVKVRKAKKRMWHGRAVNTSFVLEGG